MTTPADRREVIARMTDLEQQGGEPADLMAKMRAWVAKQLEDPARWPDPIIERCAAMIERAIAQTGAGPRPDQATDRQVSQIRHELASRGLIETAFIEEHAGRPVTADQLTAVEAHRVLTAAHAELKAGEEPF